jgi:two-component system, LytTR family, response regulator
MKIRTIIADDEEPARRLLRSLLDGEERIEIVGEAVTAAQVVSLVEDLEPDLLLLDIRLPGRSAFDALGEIASTRLPFTIFVTAYEEYAVKAFEMRAVDYLLKPVHPDRFADALNRAIEMIEGSALRDVRDLLSLTETARGRQSSGRLAARTRTGTVFVQPEEIDWVRAEGNYVRLHVGKRSFLLRSSMMAMTKRLGGRFIRVHRGALVNRERVSELRKGERDQELAVLLEDGTLVPVGDTYRKELERSLGS